MTTGTEINSWAFSEAKKILQSIEYETPEKGFVLFETGYGPSGLPHIGTFGEVVRTAYVIKAFRILAPNIPTKLYCVSDDYDGLRKIPDNVPNKEKLIPYINVALSKVPDPFGTHESYAANMNNRLCSFLEVTGFNKIDDPNAMHGDTDFYFCSSYQAYKNGVYNETLKKFAVKIDTIASIVTKTLGEERQNSYHPFMPVEQDTGVVLQTGVKGINLNDSTITFTNTRGEEVTQSFLNGGVKLQWKCDFPMRWIALGVNYEIYGKDVYTNAHIYREICHSIGAKPPVDMCYELFLDQEGKKISKSKGNGLTIDEWLRYANQESLAYYMYLKPQTAKRLFFDVIPKAVDEYLVYSNKLTEQDAEQDKSKLFENPAFYANYKTTFSNKGNCNISYSMLLNLAAACNPENKEILWQFLLKYYNKDVLTEDDAFYSMLDNLLEKAINYYNDFIKIHKRYISLNIEQKVAMNELLAYMKLHNLEKVNAEELQTKIYQIGKDHNFELKDWFGILYQSILGLDSGPRLGSFFAIYGIDNAIRLIENALSR